VFNGCERHFGEGVSVVKVEKERFEELIGGVSVEEVGVEHQ
jgi:hypothetical protein